METNNHTGKVTLSCRVTPNQKIALSKRAKELGMSSRAEYVEAIITKQSDYEQKVDKLKQKVQKLKNELAYQQKRNEEQAILIQQLQAQTNKQNDELSSLYASKLITEELQSIFEDYLNKLTSQHPDQTKAQIITAALIQAFNNDQQFFKRPLTYFFKEVVN